MSIERHAGQQQLVCDCGISQPTTYQADARREGFVIAKVAGEWTHTCQDCSRPAKAQRKLL